MVGQLQLRLGRNLRRLRAQRQLSQEEFAEVLRIHRTYVGGLERGERNPSLQVIERLAEDLGIDPIELLHEPRPGEEQAAPTLLAAETGRPSGRPERGPSPGRPRPDR